MSMTREDAIDTAMALASANGWPWKGRVDVVLHKRNWFVKWLMGKPDLWSVTTNTEFLGNNVTVVIDNDTGNVVSSGYSPR